MIRILTSKEGTSRSYVPMTWEVKKLTELLLGPDCRGVWYEMGDLTDYIDGEVESLAKEHGFKVSYEIDPRTKPRATQFSPEELDTMDGIATVNASVETLFARSEYQTPNSYRSINQ